MNESSYPASHEGHSAVSGHTESESEDNEDVDDHGHVSAHPVHAMVDDSDLESSDDDESIEDMDKKKGKHFKLREILFYDDKISIFKARHGRV